MLFNLFSKWLRDNLITYCFSASLPLFTAWAAFSSCKWGQSPCWVDWQASGPLLVLHSLCMCGQWANVPTSVITSLPLISFLFHFSFLWKALGPLAAAGTYASSVHPLHPDRSSPSRDRILFLRSSFVCEVPRKMKLGYSSGLLVLPIRTPAPSQGRGPLLRNSKQSVMGAREYFRNQRLL